MDFDYKPNKYMESLIQTAKTLLERMGFSDVGVEAEPKGKKLRIFINEGEWMKQWIPRMITDLEHILRLAARKEQGVLLAETTNDQTHTESDTLDTRGFIFIDINNYRKERDRLIVEIAKAAARKCLINKGAISLPAMNAYERRLVHTELATRPDVKTESIGEGPGRYVVVKPL